MDRSKNMQKGVVCLILRVRLVLCIWLPRVEWAPPRCAPSGVAWACMYMRPGPMASGGVRPSEACAESGGMGLHVHAFGPGGWDRA